RSQRAAARERQSDESLHRHPRPKRGPAVATFCKIRGWDYMSDHPGGLTREHVVWAYRLLLDRDPESEDVIGPKLAGSRDTRELRRHLMTSAEFTEKNRDYAHANDRTVIIKELEGDGSARLFVDLSDHVIGLNIVRGSYEAGELAFVRGVLRPGDT